MNKLNIVQNYINYRNSNNISSILELCSNDIQFIDAYGVKYNGKTAFEEYLKIPTPTSEWYKPVIVGDIVIVKGRVYKMFMWWGVSVKFEFNNEHNFVMSEGYEYIKKITLERT